MANKLNLKYCKGKKVYTNRFDTHMLKSKFAIRQHHLKILGENQEIMEMLKNWIYDNVEELFGIYKNDFNKNKF